MKCQNCGAELAPGVAFCRECGAKVVQKKRFCRECGAEIAEGVKFCSNCGAKINIDMDSASSSDATHTRPATHSTEHSDSIKEKMSATRENVQRTVSKATANVSSISKKNTNGKKTPLIALLGAIVVICLLFSLIGGNSSKKDNKPSSGNTSTESTVATNYTIEKGTEYAYMSGEWDVYIATAISDQLIQIENWNKTLSSSKSVSHEYDLGTFKINDPENGFFWIDDSHTAFSIIVTDKNNSDFKKGKAVVFTINISDGNDNKGSDYNKKIACYSYVNDDWHLYRAIALTPTLIKIEAWQRPLATSLSSYLFGGDVCVIDTTKTDTDFAWTDDEHTSFTITMKDPGNKSYWKDDTFVAFTLENDGYKYSDVISFLGKGDVNESTQEQRNGFDSSSNEVYSLGSFTIEIPQYWESSEKTDEGSQWYAETGGKVAMLQISCSPETDQNYAVTFDSLLSDNDNMIKSIEETAFKEVTGSETIDTGVVKGILYKGILDAQGISGHGYWFTFPSENDRCWCTIICAQTDNTEYLYEDDFMQMLSSIRKADSNPASSEEPKTSEPETTKAPEPETTKAPETVGYSTNTKDTVKNGNAGVYSYKSRGGSYDIYYIIDFDEGYVYYFCDGNGDETCDRIKIDSGTLNDVVIITYHDGGDTWQEGLHFKWSRQPDHLIMEDHNHFEYDFYTTDLTKALAKRDSKTIHDY